MQHQLWRDTEKLNELQPKVKALRALLQELEKEEEK
jgi:membrane protein insertase Oxa1/YidC/SpoIIIJ